MRGCLLMSIIMAVTVNVTAYDLTGTGGETLLAFEKDTAELGVLTPGETYEGAFKYRSRYSKPLNAQLITATCRCQFLEAGDLFLQPGMTAIIPAHDEGHLLFSIQAPDRGPIDDYFNIKVFADGVEHVYRLYLKGTVREVLKVPEGGLSFDLEQSPETLKKRVDLSKTTGSDVDIKDFIVTPRLLDVTRVGPMKLEISLRDEIFQHAGQTTWIELKIRYMAHDNHLERVIPIGVRVPNPCTVTPNPLIFGRITQDHQRVATARLTFQGDFRLQDVLYAPKWSAVRFGKIPGKNAYVVYIELTQAPPEKRFRDHVMIGTNRAGRPVKIRFVGNYTQWPSGE